MLKLPGRRTGGHGGLGCLQSACGMQHPHVPDDDSRPAQGRFD